MQIDGTEILMDSSRSTGRLRRGSRRPARAATCSVYFEQLREAMAELARHGVAHGDLSPYNILAAGERLVIIDLPQAVDIVASPTGMDFLMRDCVSVCTWFRARGLDPEVADEHALRRAPRLRLLARGVTCAGLRAACRCTSDPSVPRVGFLRARPTPRDP